MGDPLGLEDTLSPYPGHDARHHLSHEPGDQPLSQPAVLRGRLKPSAEAAKKRLRLTWRPWVYGEVLDPNRPDILVEVAHTGRGMRSEEEAEPADIVVDMVERIQGQERDLVIVSLTTSDPAHAADRADLNSQPSRPNVSITRLKVKRIVIGSPHLLRAEPKDSKHRPWVEHFRALHKQSTRVRHSG